MRIRIRDPDLFGPGSGMEKFVPRDKHPGPATLIPCAILARKIFMKQKGKFLPRSISKSWRKLEE
jgi:hypothetical protein